MRHLMVLTLTRRVNLYHGLCGFREEKIRAYVSGSNVYGNLARQHCVFGITPSGRTVVTFPEWDVMMEHIFN